MTNNQNKAWQQYEAGKEYKNRLGLYERVKQNEAFYRGEQWQNGEGAGLSKPVFNIVRRIVDFLVCSVASSDLSVTFTDENLPFYSEEDKELSRKILTTLNQNTAYRWEVGSMEAKLHRVLTDAAISGDGAFYCYWDTAAMGAGNFKGDIVTSLIDSTCIYPADTNLADIQSQEYIIVSGRASVASLKREAEAAGLSFEDIEGITADEDTEARAGKLSQYELVGDDEKKATFIVKFWREGGKVCFEKSTKDCVICRTHTDCTLYPIAYFNFTPAKDCFHGVSPVSEMRANQKFVNRAYAMAMKHMTDTAFSKVIYDKSKIPEWSNEVGEAIAAMGGGNISDAVSVVGTGRLEDGFYELIDSAVTLTKELMGATESALGNLEAHNTSAILALQETSRISLDHIRYAFYECIEQLADIWADMICAFYPTDRLLPCTDGKQTFAASLDTEALRSCMLRARVDVSEISRFGTINTQTVLDKLLDGGHISVSEYLRRLPAGMICDREALIEHIETNK